MCDVGAGGTVTLTLNGRHGVSHPQIIREEILTQNAAALLGRCASVDFLVRTDRTALDSSFLPARRYASAGNSDRNVSVCPSVRLSRAGIVSKRRKLAS